MNYSIARKAMVDSQLAPNGINGNNILDIFLETPRERFLPIEYQSTCYKDDNITLPNGRVVLDPTSLGKMITSLNINQNDVVLCIGDISGYAAAIISPIASTVVRVEEDPHALAFSEEIYKEMEIMNIVSIEEKICNGDSAHAPFDKILLCGASHKAPTQLLEQLSYGGQIAYIEKKNDLITGQIIVKTRIDATTYEDNIVGESSSPYCLGYEPEKEFSF